MKRRTILSITALLLTVGALAATATLTIEQLITGSVIKYTIDRIATDYERTERTFTDYNGEDWFFRTMNREARTAVFTHVVGGEKKAEAARTTNHLPALWYGIQPDADTPTPLGPWNMLAKFGRSTLANPTALKAIYLLHKDTLIAALQEHILVVPVRDELRTIVPYFDRTAPQERIEKLARRLKMNSEAKEPKAWDEVMAYEKQLRDAGITFTEQEAYEFSERRRKEGDTVLIQAYAWCLQDLIAALTNPRTTGNFVPGYSGELIKTFQTRGIKPFQDNAEVTVWSVSADHSVTQIVQEKASGKTTMFVVIYDDKHQPFARIHFGEDNAMRQFLRNLHSTETTAQVLVNWDDIRPLNGNLRMIGTRLTTMGIEECLFKIGEASEIPSAKEWAQMLRWTEDATGKNTALQVVTPDPK